MLFRLLITGVFLLGPINAYSAPVVATVSDLKGEVKLRPAPDVQWRLATLDEGVSLGETVQTAARSATELTFLDGTVLALGELTRLGISVILFDVTQAPPEIRVALQAGEAEVQVARLPLVIENADGSTRRLQPGDRARLQLKGDRVAITLLPGASGPVLPVLVIPGASDQGRTLPSDLAPNRSRLRIKIKTRRTP